MEYDFAITLEHFSLTDDNITEINFPESCVLYIRNHRDMPPYHEVRVRFAGGQSIMYQGTLSEVESCQPKENGPAPGWIADYVIPEDNPSRERIGDVMGGQILKLRSEKLREEGREEGRTLEIYSMVQDGDTSPERAARRLGITIPILKSRMSVSGYRYPEV